jgi:hypothetical protein
MEPTSSRSKKKKKKNQYPDAIVQNIEMAQAPRFRSKRNAVLCSIQEHEYLLEECFLPAQPVLLSETGNEGVEVALLTSLRISTIRTKG